MSAQSNTNVQLITTPQPNMNSTPSQFLDQTIAIETLKLMDKTLNGGNGWTWAVVGTVAFIISIDGIKRVMINLIDKSITYLCNLTGEQWFGVGQTVLYPVKLTIRGVTYPYRFACKKIYPPIVEKEPYKPKMYNIECSESTWKLLYTRPEFKYDSETLSIKNEGNGTEYKQIEKWSNMSIVTPSFIVHLNGSIKNTFSIRQSSSGEIIKTLETLNTVTSNSKYPLFEWNEEFGKIPNSKSITYRNRLTSDDINEGVIGTKKEIPKSYTRKEIASYIQIQTDNKNNIVDRNFITFLTYDIIHYIPQKFLGIYYGIMEIMCNSKIVVQIVRNRNTYYYQSNIDSNVAKTLTNNFCYTELYQSLCEEYVLNIPGNFNYKEQLFYMHIILLYIAIGDDIEIYKSVCSKSNVYFRSMNHIVFLKNKKIVDDEVELSYLKKIKKYIVDEICKDIDPEVVLAFRSWCLHYFLIVEKLDKDNTPNSVNTANRSNTASTSLSFYISSTLNSVSAQPEHLTHWLTKVSNEIETNNDDVEKKKIKIHYIRMIEETEEVKTKNSEYENWMKVVTQLGILKSEQSQQPQQTNSVSNSPNLINLDFMKSIPQEYISETKVQNKVDIQHLNSIYKGFHTLYLQNEDKKRLYNCLDNFKNRKHLLQELGFPLKLGVLLYGLPGTGKSATILSIASYLQKDLFYVDLKTIKTNGDLKKIFDHILTINLNGGILVFEDIDCATNVVKKRTSSNQVIDNSNTEATTTSIANTEKEAFTLDYFLNVLQGTLTRDNTIFIMTTNFVENLDDALIRDGRIDVKIEMKLTNKEQLTQMWKTIFKRDLKPEVLNRFIEYKFTPASILASLSQYLASGETIDDEDICKPFLQN